MPDTAGNSLDTATPLDLSTTVQRFPDLVTPANNDYYRFMLTTRSSLNLALTGLDADADVEVLDSEGNPISVDGVALRSDNSGTFSEVINTTLDPGSYFIRVYPGSGVDEANYILDIAAQDNLLSSNLLWRYPGLTGIWTLDGASFASAVLLPNDLPPGWFVGGVGDFNRDGQSDILWRNPGAALTDVWFMNGTTLLSSASLFPALDAGWVVGGTGDFNKDGLTDIVWRNETLARTDVWYMDGTALQSSTSFSLAVGAGWEIGAVGDFNQDGNIDLLWRDRVSLTTGFWLLDDALSIQAVSVFDLRPGPGWVLGGAADFNQDGNLDLLWRSNGPDGTVGGWYLDRTAFASVFTLLAVPDPLWVVKANYNIYGEPEPLDLAGNEIETALDIGKDLAGAATYRDRVGGTLDSSDFYQFNLSSGSRVTLSLDELGIDADLGLYDSNGALIQVSTQVGTTPESIIAQLDAGTYYIQVVPFNAAEQGTYALTISINAPPVLVSNTILTLSEAGTASLTDALLLVTDADNPPQELIYTVTGLPLNGVLLIDGVTAIAGATFSQAALSEGTRIRYVHNGSETTSDRFVFTVSDESGGFIDPTTFSLAVTPVNDPPSLVSNLGLTLAEGATGSLTSDLLVVTDVDSPVAGLLYSITSLPTNGTLLLAGTAVTTFTQADLLSGAVSYRHDGSETTSDRFIFSVIDGAGAILPGNTFEIAVTPVNDAPGVAVNLGLTVTEGDSANILSSLLNVTDPDNDPSQITYSIASLPTNGTLLLAGTAATSFTQADLLSGAVSYEHNGTETTSDRFIFTITDGLIPTPVGPTTFNIAIAPVNDPPVLTNNGGLTLSEGSTAFITSLRLLAVDPEGETPIVYTLDSLPTNGILRRGTQTLSLGETFTQADVNTNQLVYIHNDSETTTDTFRFTVTDAAGAILPNNSFNIAILPVNDAPLLTLPTGVQSVDQSTNTLIPGIRVTDVDLGAGEVTVTLTAGNGVLSLGNTTGITFLTGDGIEDQTVSFRGAQDVTNFVLQSLIYRAADGFQGSDAIAVSVNDGGNTGLGGVLTTNGSISLNIAPVNEGPDLTVPTTVTVREDVSTPIVGISIADADAGDSLMRVSLLVTNGTLSLASTTGITLITGDGSADKTLVFSGTLSEVNRVLGGLTYQSDRDFNGSDTIRISVSDSLNNSSGIPLSDSAAIALTITPVNDAPRLTLPDPLIVNENSDLRLSGIRITDVDATGDLTMTLFTSGGRLTLGNSSGLTFIEGDGSQDDVMSFRGRQAAINAALDTLTYRANTNFNGTDTISINVSDGGGTGLGGVLSDAGDLIVTVQGINDSPVITLPSGNLSVGSNTNLAISGIQIADPDAGGELLSVSLLAANGVLTVNNRAGLTFSQGDGVQDQRLTFSGTLSAINAAIGSLVYRSYPGFTNAFDRLTIQVTDNGNTGAGVPLSDSKSLLINVGGAVNQVPVGVVDTYSVPEDGTLSASSVLANDVDPDFTVPLTAELLTNPSQAQQFTWFSNGQFVYIPNPNFEGTDTIVYRAVDALGGASSPVTVTINVTGVNDPPIAVNDTYTVPEDQPFTTGAVLANDTDVDNTVPLSAQLVTGPTNASAFTFNADGTFSYTPRPNFNGVDTFTYVVIDGLGATSNTAVVTLSVSAANDAPIARNDGPFTVGAGGTLNVTGAGVLANDTDADTPLANLTAVLVTPPAGNLVLNANGSFTYQPVGNFSGVDTFVYQVSDGALTSNLATVTISVGSNTSPIAINDTFNLPEDAPLGTGTVLGNDLDPDNHLPLSVTLVTGPSQAAVFSLNANGTFDYQPNANFNGVDTFVYRAIDALGAISSNAATVTFNVTAVNDAPVAVNDTLSLAPGSTLTVTTPGILANDTDVEGSPLSAVLVNGTTNGVLTLNANGSFTYRPNAGFTGTDSFTYRANDGSVNSANPATVTLVVTADANLNPIATPDTFTTPEDTRLTTGNVLANDTDPDGNSALLIASVVTLPSNALSFTLNADGTFVYQGAPNFNGVDSFAYVAIDPIGGQSTPTTVTVSVTPVNDAPIAVGDAYTLANTGSFTLTAPGILANDTDIDSPTLTASLVTTAASGTLSLNPNGSFTYTPNSGFTGTDTFTYRASDGSLTSNLVTVSLSVTAAPNVVPIANADTFNATEDTLLTTGNVLANDTDPDNNLPLVAELIASPSNALSFTLNPDGSFVYQAAADFTGVDTFTYVAVDSLGGRSQTATVTFSVAPVNDAPVAVGDVYSLANTGSFTLTAPGILANDTDIDSPTITATLVTTAANGTLNLAADGSFTYTPNSGFTGTDSFTYRASDGSLTSNLVAVSLSVTIPPNAVPIANADTFNATEDTLLTTGNVLANDTDPDGNIPLVAAVIAAPSNALSFTLNTDGSFVYQAAPNFNGVDTFTYVAVDSLGGRSQTATVTVSVAPVNDAPIANNNTFNVLPSTPLTVTLPGVLANDSDVDGDALTATLVSTTGNGTLNLLEDGSFTYTPTAGFTGTDTFTYQASDGTTVSNLAIVSIVVSSNLFPTAAPDTFTVQEDGLLTTGNVLTNDGDPDGNLPLIASVITTPGNALSFSLNADGSFVYQPALNFNGVDSFTYVAVDNLGGISQPTTVTLSVTPVNDAPIANNETRTVNTGSTTIFPTADILQNDTDVDGNPLTAVLVTGPTNGTLSLTSNGLLAYTPNAGFTGNDFFTYRANDGTTDSNLATVSVTVNDIPVAQNNSYTAAIGGTLSVSPIEGVLSNDSDAIGLPLSAALFTDPSKGTVSLNFDGSFTYVPNAGASGVDSFTYLAFDGFADSQATVTITLQSNSAPIATNDAYRVATNGTLNVGLLDRVLSNDSDPDGDTLSATLLTTTTRGALTLNPNGTFTYIPQAGFTGVDSFTYRASDGLAFSTPATVTITVSSNTPPVANNDTYNAFSGIPLIQQAPGVRGNDTDANGDPLTISLVSTPANGSLTLNADGSFLYTATPTFTGVDTFVYRAFDGVDSATATVTLSVVLNTPPIAQPDVYGVLVNQTLTVTTPGVLSNDTDPEGTTLFALGGGTTPSSGVLLVFSTDGSFVYRPNPGFVGVDSFTYQASDGVSSSVGTVTVSVAANGAPTANPDTYSVNPNNVLSIPVSTGILANDTDPNIGQPLSASVVTNPLQGVLSLNANGSFTYTPNAGASGTDSFTYLASDGSLSSTATVAIAINTTSTPPTAQNDGGYTVAANGTLSVAANTGVLVNDTDPDGDRLRATLVVGASGGSVALNADGSFVYRPNANFQGTDSFVYQALDGLTMSGPGVVFVTVGGANAAPVIASPGSQLIQQDTTLTLASGLSVSDADAGSNPVRMTLSATNGLVTLSRTTGLTFTTGDGTSDATMEFTGAIADINAALTNLRFVPTTGFTGTAQIALTANDQGSTGIGGPQTGTATVTVNVSSGAAIVTNINPGTASANPTNLTNVNGTVYFAATDGTAGVELWRSGGTAGTTTRVADINSGSASSSPSNFTLIGSFLYYTATTSSTGAELWQTDITTGTSTIVSDLRTGISSSSPQSLTNYGNSLFFVATDGTGAARELWRLNGSVPTKVSASLSNVSNLTVAGNTLYFTSGNGAQLWKLDSPTGTPQLVRDLSTGAAIANLTVLGDRLFFTARDSAGVELWSSDGTTGNTNRVTDLNPGAADATPRNLVVLNGVLYFFAVDSSGTFKLFQSTAAGAVTEVAGLPSTGNAPTQLTVVGNTLFFVVDTGTVGSPNLQLWSSTGSTATLVRDLNGAGNDAVSGLTNFNGTLYFVANDGTDFKIFRSDGTSAGTVAVTSGFATAPTNLTVSGNRLLFTATDATNGAELWAIG